MSKPKPTAPPAADTAEDRLDEALDETFPASDPIAIDSGEPPAAEESTPAPATQKKRH
ncbi:hypothetical protein [Paraburkholderia sp. BCC1885]|jgi:hypothetical protein|uniref:hypothetical protein n=1 Tax=Paraburkholderia sp. BCC1885 TaxID=2562669 RepID=UPI00164235B9|nr:hypothetical protein [Paraburkholderia sp. BCC1885]